MVRNISIYWYLYSSPTAVFLLTSLIHLWENPDGSVITRIFHNQESEIENCKIFKIKRALLKGTMFLLPPMCWIWWCWNTSMAHPETFWNYRKFPSTVLMTFMTTSSSSYLSSTTFITKKAPPTIVPSSAV